MEISSQRQTVDRRERLSRLQSEFIEAYYKYARKQKGISRVAMEKCRVPIAGELIAEALKVLYGLTEVF